MPDTPDKGDVEKLWAKALGVWEFQSIMDERAAQREFRKRKGLERFTKEEIHARADFEALRDEYMAGPEHKRAERKRQKELARLKKVFGFQDKAPAD